jgi:RecJ-like exonuclease
MNDKITCPKCKGAKRVGVLKMPCPVCGAKGKIENDPWMVEYYIKQFGIKMDSEQMNLFPRTTPSDSPLPSSPFSSGSGGPKK